MVDTEQKLRHGLDKIDFETASRSFSRFLDFVKVVEAPQFATGFQGGPTPFVKWPHLAEFAEVVPHTSLTVIGKARQNGFSWVVSAYAAWLLRFHPYATVPIISQGQVEAGDMIQRIRHVLDNLPESWRVEYEPDATLELGIKEMNSMARALASTKNAGRSLQSTCVIIDEAEAHEYLPLSMMAIKPTIDAGGQIIMGSTVDKTKHQSVFKQHIRGSPKNGWKVLFWGWGSRPGRDQAWWDKTYREAAEDEGILISPDLYMEQEYPNSLEEMLAASRVISAFNADALKQMREYVREPIETKGNINIYQYRGVGIGYVAASDVGGGLGGGDDSVTVVLDPRNGTIVADIQTNELPPDEFAEESVKLLSMFNSPQWAIEENGPGGTVLTVAKQLNYPRIYSRMPGPYSKRRIPGWRTDVNTRGAMWRDLASLIKTRKLVVHSKRGLAQFDSVVQKTMKNGSTRFEHQYGTHDDYPTAVAIAWQIEGLAGGSGGELVTIPSRVGVL